MSYDAVGKAYMMMGMRQDLHLEPADMRFGLFDDVHHLDEVYFGSFGPFKRSVAEHAQIHSQVIHRNPHPSLVAYTKDSSKHNAALWANHTESTEIDPSLLDHIKNIDSSIPLRQMGKMTVFTGLPASPISSVYGDWHSDKQLKTFHNPAFTSTSTDINTAYRFTNPDNATAHHEDDHHGIVLPNARHILRIDFDGGTQQLCSTQRFSKVDHREHEILLGRGYEVNVHARPIMIGQNVANPVYLWHGVEPQVNAFRKEF